jgi:hypothetical protein
VTITFSRHAQRRAKLYGIQEFLIEDILKGMELVEGEHEIIREVPDFTYPLKIIVSVKNNFITVITNYPLKKGRKK